MDAVNAWGFALVGLALVGGLYPYALYPLALWVAGAVGTVRRSRPAPSDESWPPVSITVPVYNEAHQIAELVESLIALQYPPEKKQILIVSDASTDGTDEIVLRYRSAGVELIRQPERRGKTAAENAVAPHLRGEIVVNTDASIRIHRDALKALVKPFLDPAVGLASGRDVSVGRGDEDGDGNRAEGSYVGYEMWIRDLETRAGGIVGASGCFYAIRRQLHGIPLPDSLSRDFAAALNTRERGYVAISVPAARCSVPRSSSLKREYARKVRTITRGIGTLAHKRRLLNPLRFGLFSWMLFSHKVCRWLVPWFGLLGLLGLALLATEHGWARVLLAIALGFLAIGALAWRFSDERKLPGLLAVPAFFLMGNVAAMHAGLRALRGARDPVWEPTRRSA
jgi:cellulose synthase/poly-beta-1,6-N-acetylglucosamine synthase-like glycosyltransferase